MTEQRDHFLNYKSLGYQYVKGGLDAFMLWKDKETRNKIDTYKEIIQTDEEASSIPVKTGAWFDVTLNSLFKSKS